MKRIMFLVLLSLQWGSLAVMAQGVGAISGTVVDASGGVLPGANVSLISVGVIGGNQQAVTDARGVYQFQRLVPGTYGVKAELPGFQITTRENIIVNANVTARADLTLQVGELAEGVIVTGEAPLLDTSSALNQTVLDRQFLAALPSRIDMWSIGRAVPSVIMNKYDVGGTESYANSSATVHGATEGAEGQFMIDGMAIDTGSTGGTSGMYPNPFGFEELNYQAGNAPAENMKGGLVYNMITRTGTNGFRGQYMFNGANRHLQSNNITPALKRDLLSGVPARALAANPDLSPTADILRMFNTAVAFSGPIVRDKLWFAVTADYGVLDQLKVGSYNPDGSQFLDDNRRKSYSVKISWQMAFGHQLHAYHVTQDKGTLHRTADTPTQFYESRWTEYQTPNARMIEQVRWTGALSSRLLAEVGSSVQWGAGAGVKPQPEVSPGDLSSFDSVTQTHMNSRPTYNTSPQHRAVLKPTLGIILGAHDLKVGYEATHSGANTQNFSFSHFPSGLRAVFRNGVPDSVNTYNTPTGNSLFLTEQAVYVQDKWQPLRKLTVNAGLRLESAKGGIPARCQEETIFITGQCWAEQKNVTDFMNLTPRVSFIYDVFGNGRTALKFSANRYVHGLGTGFSSRLDPVRVTNDTRSWTDLNRDLFPQLNELGPSSGFNLGTTNRYAEATKRPHANEFSTSVEHQLAGAMVVSAAFYHRQTRGQIGSKNMAVPMESYTPIQVVERNSGLEVTVYNQDPALLGKFDTLWDNFSELDGNYNGVDLNFRKRLSNRWMILGGASFSRNTGDIYGTSDLNNPNFTFRRGVLASDTARTVKASGLYELPYGISFSGSAQYSTGFPERTTVSVGRDSATLTQVTQSLVVEPAGTTRQPSVTLFDISFRKVFRMNKTSVEPLLDIFNLGNINTITNRSTQLGTSYGRVASIIRGRMVKFGLNVTF